MGLQFYNLDSRWFFNKHFGLLLKIKDEGGDRLTIPDKVESALKVVINPYLVTPANGFFAKRYNINFITKIYARLLVFCGEHFFLALKYLMKIAPKKYPDTVASLRAFKTIFPGHENQISMCLARAFFVMSTSRSFEKNGVLFIGVFSPTRRMHAWVIEDGKNPDGDDNIWILYKPVAAYTF